MKSSVAVMPFREMSRFEYTVWESQKRNRYVK